MSALTSLAVWLYLNGASTTRAFWRVSLRESERERFDAIIAGANARFDGDPELQVQSWDDARVATAEAIFDNRLTQFYSVKDKTGAGLSDETVLEYWNYCNGGEFDDAFGTVPSGGAVTLEQFTKLISAMRPRPNLRVVPDSPGGPA